MPDKELRSFERLLMANRDQLVRNASIRTGASQAVKDPADSADLANHSQEGEITARLRENESRLLRAIEDALARIRRGKFGVCANCGQPIGGARLEAVPWTRLCLACKQQLN